MRRYMSIGFLLGLLCLSIQVQAQDLVGDWHSGDTSNYLEFSFQASGLVDMVVAASGNKTPYNGSWQLQGDRLELSFADAVLSYSIQFFANNQFVLVGEGIEAGLFFERVALQAAENPLAAPQNPLTAPENPLATPQPASPDGSANILDAYLGIWTYKSQTDFEQLEESLYLAADGRYISVYSSQLSETEPSIAQEEGVFTITDGQMTFKPWCRAERSFPVQHTGSSIILSAQDELGQVSTYEYRLEPESQNTLLTEFQRLDAERAVNNQPYLERTPVGQPVTGPVAQPGLPVDPNPTEVFAGVMVFREGELYTYLSDWYYAFDVYGQLQTVNAVDIAFNQAKIASLDYTRGTYYDTAQWYFLPNGRFYSKTELYGFATSLNPLTPQTTAFWGKYRIDQDKLIIQEDAGAVTSYWLLDGRRILAQPEAGICYDEVEWATEKLEQQSQELQ